MILVGDEKLVIHVHVTWVGEVSYNLQIWVEQFRGGIHPLGCNHLDLNVFARNPAVSAYCVEWNGLFVNSGKIVIWHCK